MALLIGNDMVIEFSGDGKLTDENGNAVTGATVEVTLYEIGDDGSEVSGVTWPVTLNDDGSGEYSGVLPASADIKQGHKYKMELSVETSGGSKGLWQLIERAEYRD